MAKADMIWTVGAARVLVGTVGARLTWRGEVRRGPERPGVVRIGLVRAG